jgi:FkbM family methyltransferase
MTFFDLRDHTLVRHLLGHETVVLDLGANKGDFSHGMIATFGSRCYAVEASPALFASIPDHPRLIKLNAAVAGQSGSLPFHVNENPEAGSIYGDSLPGRTDAITVRAVTIVELLDLWHLTRVDVVKLDIEGAEIEALAACPDALLQSVTQFTIEFHDFNGLCSREAVEKTVARFQQLGFWCHRYSCRSYANTLFVNRRQASIAGLHLRRAWDKLRRLA